MNKYILLTGLCNFFCWITWRFQTNLLHQLHFWIYFQSLVQNPHASTLEELQHVLAALTLWPLVLGVAGVFCLLCSWILMSSSKIQYKKSAEKHEWRNICKSTPIMNESLKLLPLWHGTSLLFLENEILAMKYFKQMCFCRFEIQFLAKDKQTKTKKIACFNLYP